MLYHFTKIIKISLVDDDGIQYEVVQLKKTAKGKTRITPTSTKSSQKIKHVKEPKSIMDHLMLLKTKGFFNVPRSRQNILKKLASMNKHYDAKSIDDPLRRAFKSKKLGRVSKKGLYWYVSR